MSTLLASPIRYSYQNSFVTNHCQLQYRILFRNSRSQRFLKISVLKIFTTLTGKHLCWCINDKVEALMRGILFKKDNDTGVFL